MFNEYPNIKTAFNLVQGLRNIFNTAKSIEAAYTKLAHWYKDVEQSGFRAFGTIANFKNDKCKYIIFISILK